MINRGAKYGEGSRVGRNKGTDWELAGVVGMMVVLGASVAHAQDPGAPDPGKGTVSGLPIPRFVSLKSDEVNLRAGPGKDYPTQWVFRRAGLPVEIVKEFDNWRQVRDADGVTGWVNQALLSGRRTAQVLPWDVKPGVARPKLELKSDDSERAQATALIEAGVIANLQSCDSRWCYVTVETYKGYVEQSKLWGIYPGEVIK
jgi:SH3-like domain-containing protein